MNNLISTIEIFPNELFIELFEYLSPSELYQMFYNLNSRFNSMIKSLQHLHLILQEDWDTNERISPFFASQISILTIKHDEFIDFSSYSNLQSLKLSMPTITQCNAIQPSLLPKLKHLFISNLFFTDNSEQLCRLIFSSSFSHLQTCRIDRITFNRHYSYLSLSLRQLTISPCTWKTNLYQQIFQACPNLTHLRIIRLRNVSFKFLTNHFSLHTSLRYLSMHFYSIGNDWYHHIHWLLTHVPNLESFILRIEQNETNIEFPLDLLAKLLIRYLPFLINLKIKISLNKFLSKELNLIEQLHPLFINVQYLGCSNRHSNKYLIISSQ